MVYVTKSNTSVLCDKLKIVVSKYEDIVIVEMNILALGVQSFTLSDHFKPICCFCIKSRPEIRGIDKFLQNYRTKLNGKTS